MPSPINMSYIDSNDSIIRAKQSGFVIYPVAMVSANLISTDPGDEILVVDENGVLSVLNESYYEYDKVSASLNYPSLYRVKLQDYDIVLIRNSSGELLTYSSSAGLVDLGINASVIAVGNLDNDASYEALLLNTTDFLLIYDFDSNKAQPLINVVGEIRDAVFIDADGDNINEIFLVNASGISTIMLLDTSGIVLNKTSISDDILSIAVGRFISDSLSIAAISVDGTIYLSESILNLNFYSKAKVSYGCDKIIAVHGWSKSRDVLTVPDNRGSFLDLYTGELGGPTTTSVIEFREYNSSAGIVLVVESDRSFLAVTGVDREIKILTYKMVELGDFNGDGGIDFALSDGVTLYIQLAETKSPEVISANTYPERPTIFDSVTISIKATDDSNVVLGAIVVNEKVFQLSTKVLEEGIFELSVTVSSLQEGEISIPVRLTDSWGNLVEFNISVNVVGFLWDKIKGLPGLIDAYLDDSGYLIIINETAISVFNATTLGEISINSTSMAQGSSIVSAQPVNDSLLVAISDGVVLNVYNAFTGEILTNPPPIELPQPIKSLMGWRISAVDDSDVGIVVVGKKIVETSEITGLFIITPDEEIDVEMPTGLSPLSVASYKDKIYVLTISEDQSKLTILIYSLSGEFIESHDIFSLPVDIEAEYYISVTDKFIAVTYLLEMENDVLDAKTIMFNSSDLSEIMLIDGAVLNDVEKTGFAVLKHTFLNELDIFNGIQINSISEVVELISIFDMSGDGISDILAKVISTDYVFDGDTLDPIFSGVFAFSGYEQRGTCRFIRGYEAYAIFDSEANEVYIISSPYLYYVAYADINAPEVVSQGDIASFYVVVKNLKNEPIVDASVKMRIWRENLDFERVISLSHVKNGTYMAVVSTEGLSLGTYLYEITIESAYYYPIELNGSFTVTGSVFIRVDKEQITVDQGKSVDVIVKVVDAYGNIIPANVTADFAGAIIKAEKYEDSFKLSFIANRSIGIKYLIIEADTPYGRVLKAVKVLIISEPILERMFSEEILQNETLPIRIKLSDSLGYPVDNASIKVFIGGKSVVLTNIGSGMYETNLSIHGLPGGEYNLILSVEHEFLKPKVFSESLKIISILRIKVDVKNVVIQQEELKVNIKVSDIYGNPLNATISAQIGSLKLEVDRVDRGEYVARCIVNLRHGTYKLKIKADAPDALSAEFYTDIEVMARPPEVKITADALLIYVGASIAISVAVAVAMIIFNIKSAGGTNLLWASRFLWRTYIILLTLIFASALTAYNLKENNPSIGVALLSLSILGSVIATSIWLLSESFKAIERAGLRKTFPLLSFLNLSLFPLLLALLLDVGAGLEWFQEYILEKTWTFYFISIPAFAATMLMTYVSYYAFMVPHTAFKLRSLIKLAMTEEGIRSEKKKQISSQISSEIRNKTLFFIAFIGTTAVTHLSFLTKYYYVALVIGTPIAVIILGLYLASKIVKPLQQFISSIREGFSKG